MNTYTTHKTRVRSIKPSDPNFNITTEFIVYPRAAIHISQRCPDNYKDLIAECISHGWLQPVAYMSEREMLFVGLSGNNQEA